MYTPKEWKNTLKDWSSTLGSWILEFVKRTCFEICCICQKSDFKRDQGISRQPSPPSWVSVTAMFLMMNGLLLNLSVYLRKKKITWTFGTTEMLLLVTSQSVKMNGHQYASLLKKIPCCEVSPYSNFPVVWFVTTFSF